MKKMLNLLSVLTITGTAIPNLIDASSYENENLKLKSNLENLQRVKRRGNDKNKPRPPKPRIDDDNNKPSTSNTSNKCVDTTRSNGKKNKCQKPSTVINGRSELTNETTRYRILNEIRENSGDIFKNGKRNKYKKFIRSSIDYFKETKNIVEETINPYTNAKIYRIEKHNVEDSYKKIPLNIEGNKVDLILNKSNLYVDGIITYDEKENKTLVYFDDSNLDKNSKSLKEEDKNSLFSKILKFNIKNEEQKKLMIKKLDFDSNYQTLLSGDTDIKINKKNIESAIINLTKINDKKINEMKKNKETEKTIKKDFLRVIFASAEATRFFSVREEVNKILSISDGYEINWAEYKDKLNDWDTNSQKYYKMKDDVELQLKIKLTEKQEIYDIATLAVKDDEKIRDSQ